jgi:menaquinol-cytochrome c reductase iron-sulfur subunit
MSTQNVIPPQGEAPTRRAFHLIVLNLLGALIGLALAVPTLIYLLVPPKARKGRGWLDAGDISQLVAGTPVELSFQETRRDGWKLLTEKKTAWVVKGADNKITAFGPQCTHLGCGYHFEAAKNEFFCPCHMSFFAIDGKVLAGPAPRPLDQYVTKIENNHLQIGELKPSVG